MLMDTTSIKEQMKRLMGICVREYITMEPNSSIGWKWKDMHPYMMDKKFQELNPILSYRRIIFRHESDELILSKSKDGQYNYRDRFRTIYYEEKFYKDYIPTMLC